MKFFLLNPESGKNWHVEKGNLGFGIRNTAQKIQNRPSLAIGIQYQESGIPDVESRIQDCLGFPYMGRKLLYNCKLHLFLLILGCDLILGHAVDKDLLLLIQYEVRDLVKGCNAIRSQMIEHHERLGALEEKEAAAENRSKEVEKVLEKLLSFKAQNERIGKLSL